MERRAESHSAQPPVLNTKTFWTNCSSSRTETLSGERVAILNGKLAQSSGQKPFDAKLIFDNSVVSGRLIDLGAVVQTRRGLRTFDWFVVLTGKDGLLRHGLSS